MLGWVPSRFSSLQTSSVLPLLSPEQMEVAEAARKLDKKLEHIPASLKYGCVHIPFAGVGRMKQLQFEELQLLCWSGQGGKHSEAENKSDIVHWGRAVGCKQGNAFHFLPWKHSPQQNSSTVPMKWVPDPAGLAHLVLGRCVCN